MDMHAAVGGKVGVSAAKIQAALRLDAPHELSQREQIALEYADQLTEGGTLKNQAEVSYDD